MQKRRRSSGPKGPLKQMQSPMPAPQPPGAAGNATDSGGGGVPDIASLTPEELEKIPGLKCESIEETEQRLTKGTVKHTIFEVRSVTSAKHANNERCCVLARFRVLLDQRF